MSRLNNFRILIVDDSPKIRKILTDLIKEELPAAEIETAGNGQVALARLSGKNWDLVTLDLNMPIMDGYTFLRIFRTRSRTPVLVVSSLSDLSHVEMALELGASGFLTKPSDSDIGVIKEELRYRLRHLLSIKDPSAPKPVLPKPKPKAILPEAPLSTDENFPVVLIGSSSGGPPTLQYLLSSLSGDMTAAVIVAQHMPTGFTTGFAERLDAILSVNVKEAQDGEKIVPGMVYFCPGGYGTTIRRQATEIQFKVKPEPDAICTPSIDDLFISGAIHFGNRVLGIILTGMGKDGSEGVCKIKETGGKVIVESEETAKIFGMPKQAAATGCVDHILPLQQIAINLMKYTS